MNSAAGAGVHGPVPRDELAARTVGVLKRGSGAKPDVLLVDAGDRRLVVKDFGARPRSRVVRALGRRMLDREARVYGALAAHPSVPRCLGRIDALALAFEYRPGEPLSRALAARLGPVRSAALLERIEQAVHRMHALGVVHLDLRHRDNVLCDPDDRPVLVDFAFAMCFRPGSLWYRWYRPTVLLYDQYAVSKWRDRLAPAAEQARSA